MATSQREATTWSGGARVCLGEERVSPRFGEERELPKVYKVVYEALLWLVLDPISSILRVHEHLERTFLLHEYCYV
jgi:hypothetical protein